MMYAIVDIETTGSHANENGITEIAIVLHNGKEVEGRFETLINPGYPIPKYVSYLTGITNEMVATAPAFKEVAANIYRLLKNRIFIAHNVNFDYTFIHHHFEKCNIKWQAQRICTMRLSKRVFDGFPKYGLDYLCDALNIPVTNRHRAGGDADATAILFEKIFETGGELLIKEFLKRQSKEHILPPNLPRSYVQQLPPTAGVYYFHDEKQKIIYVGKAKNIKQRVMSHFTGIDIGKKRQEFLKNIFSISYKLCATELTASILESVEIKRHWPLYNKSQKYFEQRYGIYMFEDVNGLIRLAIDRKRNNVKPLMSFGLMMDAHRTLWKLVKKFELDPKLCFLEKPAGEEMILHQVEDYNKRVFDAIEWINASSETFAIVENCLQCNSFILFEKGKFIGIGKMPSGTHFKDLETAKNYVDFLPENEVIHSLVRSYSAAHPKSKIAL